MPYPYQPYQPYGAFQQPSPGMVQYAQNTQQPIHGFVYVTGIEGARAYPMPPNSEMPLFDSTTDGIMFVKTTDGAGFPTIRRVRCLDDETPVAQESTAYVTHDELDSTYRDLASQIEQMKEALNGLVPHAAAANEPDARQNARHSAVDGR